MGAKLTTQQKQLLANYQKAVKTRNELPTKASDEQIDSACLKVDRLKRACLNSGIPEEMLVSE